MSKKAVLVSFGPPPDHKTPDLGSSRWLYWKSRFKKQAVCFDSAQKTISCGRSDIIY